MTKALVTGATGFLGRHVCMRLNRMGWEVTGTGRSLAAGAQLEAQGIRFIRADLRDKESVAEACAGQEAVFHCGALSSPWGPYREFHAVNVDGTGHVAAGCLKHGVRRLIHISTPSIYFAGHRDRLGVREDASLPPRPVNAYAATKLQAEQVVLEAFREGLAGLILRPRAIFGPGDTALLPRLMRANDSSGIPLFREGNVMLDLTYVDNVVDAMLLGWQAPEDALGQAYNITNGEPAKLQDVLAELFAILGTPLRMKKLPYPVAYGAAALLEWSHRLLPMLGEPTFTRYSVSVLAQSQTLDIARAREKLGYAPQVSLHEGLRRFAEWWMRKEGDGG
ncbi:NAD(P)-dependent oxidoreductase [Paenibacillus sp. YN15]|uniref:NAD-dependent epimerase/dehydratase family protein n=1 Tax=Paenibacillus sp. YN15 TaxID=1742774 RepID=UPI000DCB40DE|nr:NAD-dependent epimerase/dehydratase family protein [Paenibacillus sp. YN15]RAV01957.1 3-beta hydroxysteroid dehydrogenase [Paenibacillus sp. YN15]